jgi:hypothetical protein
LLEQQVEVDLIGRQSDAGRFVETIVQAGRRARAAGQRRGSREDDAREPLARAREESRAAPPTANIKAIRPDLIDSGGAGN